MSFSISIILTKEINFVWKVYKFCLTTMTLKDKNVRSILSLYFYFLVELQYLQIFEKPSWFFFFKIKFLTLFYTGQILDLSILPPRKFLNHFIRPKYFVACLQTSGSERRVLNYYTEIWSCNRLESISQFVEQWICVEKTK